MRPALRGRVAGSGKDGCRRPGWSLTEPVLPSQTPWGVTGTLGQHGDRPDLRPSATATDRLARALPRPRGRQGTTAPTPFCKATAMVVIAVPPGPALCLRIPALALPAQAGDLSPPCAVWSSVQWGQYQQRPLRADMWTELDELIYARCLEQCPAYNRDTHTHTHGSFGGCSNLPCPPTPTPSPAPLASSFSTVSSEMRAAMNLSKGEQGRVKVCRREAGTTV